MMYDVIHQVTAGCVFLFTGSFIGMTNVSARLCTSHLLLLLLHAVILFTSIFRQERERERMDVGRNMEGRSCRYFCRGKAKSNSFPVCVCLCAFVFACVRLCVCVLGVCVFVYVCL